MCDGLPVEVSFEYPSEFDDVSQMPSSLAHLKTSLSAPQMSEHELKLQHPFAQTFGEVSLTSLSGEDVDDEDGDAMASSWESAW